MPTDYASQSELDSLARLVTQTAIGIITGRGAGLAFRTGAGVFVGSSGVTITQANAALDAAIAGGPAVSAEAMLTLQEYELVQLQAGSLTMFTVWAQATDEWLTDAQIADFMATLDATYVDTSVTALDGYTILAGLDYSQLPSTALEAGMSPGAFSTLMSAALGTVSGLGAPNTIVNSPVTKGGQYS